VGVWLGLHVKGLRHPSFSDYLRYTERRHSNKTGHSPQGDILLALPPLTKGILDWSRICHDFFTSYPFFSVKHWLLKLPVVRVTQNLQGFKDPVIRSYSNRKKQRNCSVWRFDKSFSNWVSTVVQFYDKSCASHNNTQEETWMYMWNSENVQFWVQYPGEKHREVECSLHFKENIDSSCSLQGRWIKKHLLFDSSIQERHLINDLIKNQSLRMHQYLVYVNGFFSFQLVKVCASNLSVRTKCKYSS